MSVLANSNAIETGGYNINNSLRFRSSASAYLSRTPASATNRTTWTYSVWVKRGSLSATQSLLSAHSGDPPFANFYIDSTNTINYDFDVGTRYSGNTTAVFRDPSAWYHIVMVFNSTQATAANRFIVYVNNVQYSVGTITFPQNTTPPINAATTHNIGRRSVATDNYLDGYLTEINFIDGQVLTPSSFGATDVVTGVWAPKAYTGTYGTNGFYLKFSDIATTSGSNAGLGKDFSGNGNYWTTNNISVTAGTTYDAMTDSPTLTSATAANYAVLNPLSKTTNATLSEANLKVTFSGANGYDKASASSMALKSKTYWEITDQSASIGTYGNTVFGIIANNVNLAQNFSTSTSTITFRDYDGEFYRAGTTNPAGSGAPFGGGATNDIYMFAYDPDTTKLWAGRNGTWFNSGNPASGTGAISSVDLGEVVPYVAGYQSGDGPVVANFGQRPFSYTPPTGFNRLNAYNLPDSTIKKGNSYMDATTYTGNSTTGRTISTNFYADFIWTKSRNVAYSHSLFDSVRGAGQSKNLVSNTTEAEGGGNSVYGNVSAFGSSAYTLAAGTDSGNPYANNNESGKTYVGWLWQAGQGTTSSNTAGSISSTTSVSTTAGFSIVTYTGTGANATVGHGLGVAPAMMIIKQRNSAQSWSVYHASLGATKRVYLDLTNAVETTSTAWNNTAPTSTVYSVGTSAATNGNGNTYVAYCWSEIAGFSRFGSYTGNGSADGRFVYLGFRPAFVMLKNSNTTDSWLIKDNKRAANYNPASGNLYPNLALEEDTGSGANIDFLSNGFKVRGSNISVSGNGNTIIYAAFAENPFKNSLAR